MIWFYFLIVTLGTPEQGAAEATDWMKPPGMGVKRLKPEYRHRIPGVIGYCRSKFEQQVPFDYEFRPDDAALYCVELTEKAFRSQGLVLSQPVRIGDWEHLENLSPDRPRDPVRHPADAGAPDHPGAARLLARQRTPGDMGLILAGDGRRPRMSRKPMTNHEPEPSVLLTELNVPLILEASAETAEMRPTVIRPSITAYSTAVGPSSLVRNRCAPEITPRIVCSF